MKAIASPLRMEIDQLVQATSLEGKRGRMPADLKALLARLGLIPWMCPDPEMPKAETKRRHLKWQRL